MTYVLRCRNSVLLAFALLLASTNPNFIAKARSSDVRIPGTTGVSYHHNDADMRRDYTRLPECPFANENLCSEFRINALIWRGRFKEAIDLREGDLNWRKQHLGSHHPQTATTAELLGDLYMGEGLLDKAHDMYIYALSIREKNQDMDRLYVAVILQRLADVAEARGDSVSSIELHRRSLIIIRKEFNDDSAYSIRSLARIANHYLQEEAYDKAEPLLLDALKLAEEEFGTNHPNAADSIDSLANLYVIKGLYQKAEPLLLRSIQISEERLGSVSPYTAFRLNNLAILYMRLGVYKKAEPLLLRALAIAEKMIPEHISVSNILYNLAFLYRAKGEDIKSDSFFYQAIGMESLFLRNVLPMAPISFRQNQVDMLGNRWEAVFTNAGKSDSAARVALFASLNRYGLNLEIEQRQALLSRTKGVTGKLADQISGLTNLLADFKLQTNLRNDLVSQRNELERQLYRILPSLNAQPVDPYSVARELPANGALLQFQLYRPFDGKQSPRRRWGGGAILSIGSNS